MPTVTIDAKADSGSIDSAISTWEAGASPTSIDKIDTERIGPNRVIVNVVYTA